MSIAVGSSAMQLLEVHIDAGSDPLRANLESPVPGAAPRGLWLPLAGWALAPGGEAVQIEISEGRYVFARLYPNVHRPDVAAAFPEVQGAVRSGFSAAFGVSRLPQAFELRLSGIVGGQVIPFARVSGVRRRFEPAGELPVAPLALTTLGRSGSTLLCALLASHPQISAFRPAGYDSRPFAYWLEATTAICSPGSRLALLDSAAQTGQWWLGRDPVPVDELQCLEEPVRDVLLDAQADELLGGAVRTAAAFAHRLALAEGKPDVMYAAEKCSPGYVPRLLCELSADAREVVLVRDFRDVLASMLAFNAKRGYAAFGRETVSTDYEFVQRLAADADALAAAWAERRARSLLVRYEELIREPELVLRNVFDYLGLDTSAGEITMIVAAAGAALRDTAVAHRTTGAGASSSGRWRTDLAPALQQRCGDAFAGALREFGYE